MAKIFIEESTLSAIGSSIRAKTGKTNMIPPLNMPVEIASIQTDGGGSSSSPVSANDVTFYDYDGTIVASYSFEEIQALTSLPAGPFHEGLIFQGWNWSLESIKTMNRVVNVGAIYTTNDGKTRIYITLGEGRMSPLLGCCPNGTVIVDWGDGTTPDTLTGTSTSTIQYTPTHNYTSPGNYVISLTVDGTCGFLGSSTTNDCCYLLKYSTTADTRNLYYQNAITKIELGDGVTSIGIYAFHSCYSLTSLTIPNSVTRIGDGVFYGCYSLASLTIPDNVTSIGDSAFQLCYSLTNFTIPDSVTRIGNSVFLNCYSLTSLAISDNVTSIGSNAFQYCYGMAEYHLKPTTPPTLSNTNAFNGIPDDFIIYVPQGSLEAYQTATNWATYASRMQEETT